MARSFVSALSLLRAVHERGSEALGDARPRQDLRAGREEPLPPLSIAYKKRVYSPARIRYPMKRVDFDPNGRAEHPEPGREQVRAHQLGRGARHRHQRDAPGQGEVRPHRHPLSERPARREQDRARPARLRPQAAPPLRRLHHCRCATRQLGRLVLGRQARLGLEHIGQQKPQKNLLWDIAKNAELLLFWGCDQETTTWGLAGASSPAA